MIHLLRLTFSITPDEALVETRQKLVIEKIIGSISEKMKTFGHIYDINRNYLWDTLEINWDKVKLPFNSNEIKLPKLVMIKIQDKIRVRRMMSREMQNFHIMVKQGMTWYNLETV